MVAQWDAVNTENSPVMRGTQFCRLHRSLAWAREVGPAVSMPVEGRVGSTVKTITKKYIREDDLLDGGATICMLQASGPALSCLDLWAR